MNVTVFFSDSSQRQYTIAAGNTVGQLRDWIVGDAGAYLNGKQSWMITVADYTGGHPWAQLPDDQQLNDRDLFYAYYGSP